MSRFAHRRSKQPQQSTAIDWSNPLLSQVEFILLGSSVLYNPINKSITRVGIPVNNISAAGIGAVMTESTYLSYLAATSSGGITPWTIAGIYVLGSAASGTSALAGFAEVPGSGTCDRATRLDSSQFWQGYLYDGNPKTAISSAVAVVGKPSVVVVSCDTTNLICAVNGVPEVTTAVNNAGYNGYASAEFCVGNADDTSAPSVGIPLLIRLNRAWSYAERQSFLLNPWQIFVAVQKRQRIISSTGNTYTITPSGSIAFSGAVPLLRTRLQVPSGGIVFSGAVPLLRTRLQPVSGQVIFSGTAPITYVPFSGNIYTITPSGGITFSGAVSQLRTRVQVPSGGISFSGSAALLRTRALVPSGSVVFSGAVPMVRTRIQVPSGQIVFSGGASISFIPAGSATAVALNRISIGVDRAGRLS